MWYPPYTETGTHTSLHFLLAHDKRHLEVGSDLLLDGPYGRNLKLWNYETVILVAKGVGIAGILSYALDLLSHRNINTGFTGSSLFRRKRGRDSTRKVAILWVLEDNAQEEWAAPGFNVLRNLDIKEVKFLSIRNQTILLMSVDAACCLVSLPIR
jgi:hypothetical protein